MEMSNSVGDSLRKLRESVGLSLAELARLVHVSKSTLWAVERGTRPASVTLINAIKHAVRSEEVKRRTLLGLIAATPLAGEAIINEPKNAEYALRYALWLGDQGELAQADSWYRAAIGLADWSGDQPTLGYVLARTATRGFYEGWDRGRTLDHIDRALATSQRSRVVVEAHAARIQVHAREGDYAGARTAADAMLTAASTEDEAIRAAVFVNYMECMCGVAARAPKAFDAFEQELRANYVWWQEAKVYQGMAAVRQGDRSGVRLALDAVSHLGQQVRVVGVGVSDLLKHVSWRDDEVDELRTYAR